MLRIADFIAEKLGPHKADALPRQLFAAIRVRAARGLRGPMLGML